MPPKPKSKKGGAPKKKASLYKKPPPIPPGEVLRDTNGRTWKIGPSIGVGGFGEIYSACQYKEGTDKSAYPYVVKIEPIENGPLFVECNFYLRNYNEDDIEEFMASRELSQLGMPVFLGSGEHWFQGGNKRTHLRFLVLERYGTDINKKFKECGMFPAPTVFLLGLQVLDVLDYVHSRSYIHADIKGANILLGIKPGTKQQVYLVDFGLAWRVVGQNYEPDRKCSHEGTLEYTSTDRHIGAQTMRGDLEILAYNMLQWLTGSLPWEGIEEPETVHRMKTDLVENVRDRILRDYPDVPDHLIQFFEYINTLDMPDIPNHTLCRRIFESYLSSVGKTRESELEFPLLAQNKITKINIPTKDLLITSNYDSIHISSTESKSITGNIPVVNHEKGNRNQRKPINRRPPSKLSMESDDSDTLVVNKITQNKTMPNKRRPHKKHSIESEDSNELANETTAQKAKCIKNPRKAPTVELDEDFIVATKLSEEINKESLGQRPKRNSKAPERLGIIPAKMTPKPRNNRFKKSYNTKYPGNPPDKINVSKNMNTRRIHESGFEFDKTIELNNETVDKEIDDQMNVKTKSTNELISEMSIIDLNSTSDLSTESVIEDKKPTSSKGANRECYIKLIPVLENDKQNPADEVPESEGISNSGINIMSVSLDDYQQKNFSEKIKTKLNALKEPLAVAPLPVVHDFTDDIDLRKKTHNLESENDDLDGLPAAFPSSRSKNSRIKRRRDESNAFTSFEEDAKLNKQKDKIEQNQDLYHEIESSTETGRAQSEHVDEQNITKPKRSKAESYNEHEILSSMRNSKDDNIILLGNNNERGVVIENSVIKDLKSAKRNKKHTIVSDKMSVTETSNKFDPENVGSELKSKKKKKNKSSDICISESGDAGVSNATESYEFLNDDKYSRYEDNDDFKSKPEKKKKSKDFRNKNKRRYEYDEDYQPNSKKKKTNKSSLITSPELLTDKDKGEKKDSDSKRHGKKKKKDKSSNFCAYDNVNADNPQTIARRNLSNVSKDNKTTTKKVSEHKKQPAIIDVPKTESKNVTDITKKKKKTKAREDSGSDGDFDSKYRSIPANKNKN